MPPSASTAAHAPDPLPFVYVNMGMAADGSIATANRAVTTFGSAVDHEHLLELRTGADAVMAGARTVDAAPVNLGPGDAAHRKARLKAGRREHNLRVIVSGTGTLRTDAEVFKHRFSPIVILTTERILRPRLKALQTVADEVRVCGCNDIDWLSTLRWLRRQWGVERLLCEGGGDLNAALFRAGVVDELHLTVCPILVGGVEAPTIADGSNPRRLSDAAAFSLASMRMVGSEAFLVLNRK